ncbi:hypothetical protein GCM10007853_03740 [Algimonas ampicilliniresistens]|uniref:DUF4136 domain-containing protein n=1 Tax=Algimonas ampicilliniresistens TaxID=1298735 RepID=A0ABQ5V540_9PROT|nr:hypothetical protein [Algimonas ampicilliniresistens]GLQ22500.1 hypothetical protein GCM10007853_03740 [Algimonas ampicilliniresistens]
MKCSKPMLASLMMAILISGCALSSIYHPARFAGDEGFSDQALGQDNYRVSFRGDVSTPRETVEDYLLLHAAELTLDAGKTSFLIIESDTDMETHIRGTRHPAIYGRNYHLRDEYPWSFPYYAYGYRWSYPSRWSYYETNEYIAVAYIRMLDRDEAEKYPNAFDAQLVMDSIGPVSCYKREPHDETTCPFQHNHD